MKLISNTGYNNTSSKVAPTKAIVNYTGAFKSEEVNDIYPDCRHVNLYWYNLESEQYKKHSFFYRNKGGFIGPVMDFLKQEATKYKDFPTINLELQYMIAYNSPLFFEYKNAEGHTIRLEIESRVACKQMRAKYKKDN